ncbi:uncharacterized protein LOC132624288 [Lycium barbarum]|uniref:uncharacterized protein LOC132624288 n=1 Tax=Lycium barbarum TaxID=112863 RepID=UPI00293E6F8D|nr:uncharacterized protein LOC132624288 [Lycium barbarum]
MTGQRIHRNITCAITSNDLEDDEIESIMLKTFGETFTKGAMQWYCTLPQHSIPSFELLIDAFVKAHAGIRKVQARKTDIFKIFQKDERLREFVTRFQNERMLLPAVPDEWAAQAFIQGLNPRSSNASLRLKENLMEFRAITWADIHNRYESKIRVEDDQLGLSPGPINRIKHSDIPKRVIEENFQPLRDKYHPYPQPERSIFRSDKGRSRPGPNTTRSDRQSDRGSGNRGLQFRNSTVGISNIGESLRLSEYNFNVDSGAIVATTGHIKDASWPRPLRTDPSQRDPNMICEYHAIHRHQIDDCKRLRDEVARLLKNSHLWEFLSERAKGHFKNRETSKKTEPEEPQHVICYTLENLCRRVVSERLRV